MRRQDGAVNGKSMIQLLGLGAEKGTEIVMEVDGRGRGDRHR